MFGWFRKKVRAPRAARPEENRSVTESLILQMVASGMAPEEIQQAFPDHSREDLDRIIGRGLGRLGMFLDH